MTKPVELISLIPDSNSSSYWADRMFIPEAMQKAVEPYLLPFDHPVRQKLDDIFANRERFDYVCGGQEVNVFSHDTLEGYIIKTATMMRQRHTQLLRRVEGHRAANQLIQEKNYTHIKVTQNWLYPIPGNGNFITWCVHYATRPVRLALKQFDISCPSWLKYADKILKERFWVVEERIPITKPTRSQLNASEPALVDEFIDLALEVGIQDVHSSNYCFDEKGKLVLFDLSLGSRKREKRIDSGEAGVGVFLDRSSHAEYAHQKLASLRQ